MTQTAARYIQLDYETNGRVIVTPQDSDRFVVTIQEAVATCQTAGEVLRYRHAFSEVLMPRLTEWLECHRTQVRKAFLTVRDGGLLFLVIRKKAECDPEFTAELAEFDMEVAQDSNLDLICLEVMALPDVSDEVALSFTSPARRKELTGAE